MEKKQMFDIAIEAIKKSGLEYKEFPSTYMINVTDEDGIIQSYFASTGTAVFRDGNDKYRSKKHTERNLPIKDFIAYCNGTSETDILEFFD